MKELYETANIQELLEAIKDEVGETDACKVEVKSLRKTYTSTQAAIIEMPSMADNKLVKHGTIHAGLSERKVQRRITLIQCYRRRE